MHTVLHTARVSNDECILCTSAKVIVLIVNEVRKRYTKFDCHEHRTKKNLLC